MLLSRSEVNEYKLKPVTSNTFVVCLFQMKELHHENVDAFLGLCLEETLPCILTAYCHKGSLEVGVSDSES